MASKFKRHENPQTSAMVYIDECDSLCEIGHQTNPFGLCFTAFITQEIVSKWRLDELLIDSTYKTNNQKLKQSKINIAHGNWELHGNRSPTMLFPVTGRDSWCF